MYEMLEACHLIGDDWLKSCQKKAAINRGNGG
jgi:hypothetical protein